MPICSQERLACSFCRRFEHSGWYIIDLKYLNISQVLLARKTTQVGTGNHWLYVYSKLDALDLAVMGGRNGDIGLDGLTLEVCSFSTLNPTVLWVNSLDRWNKPFCRTLRLGLRQCAKLRGSYKFCPNRNAPYSADQNSLRHPGCSCQWRYSQCNLIFHKDSYFA